MYNSKEMLCDTNLTFLSYNQTINKEFTISDIKTSDLWYVNDSGSVLTCIPLFNCDMITSSNESDKVLGNECIICQDIDETIIKCTSNDTGGVHYHSVELYSYCPYTNLDVIDEVTVYCVLYDEYLNTLNNVNVSVYVDDESAGTVVSDGGGVCRFTVDQPCTVKFVYGESVSDDVVISGDA